MCRGQDCPSGGRRCPGETPTARRARQRAAYAAKRAAAGFTVDENRGRPRTQEAPPEPTTPAPGTQAAVDHAVAAAQHALAATENRPIPDRFPAYTPGAALHQIGDHGWTEATDTGREVDTALRAAGAAIAARANTLAADDLAAIGTNPALRELRPDGFTDRDEYVAHMEKRHAQLEAQTDAIIKHGGEILNETIKRQPSSEEDREHNRKVMHRYRTLQDDAHPIHEEFRQVTTEVARLRRGDGTWDRTESAVRSQAYLAALKEQREFGRRKDTQLDIAKGSNKKALGKLEEALEYYPSDWIDGEQDYTASWTFYGGGEWAGTRFSERMPLLVRDTTGRAHYAVASHRNTKTYKGLVSEITIGDRDQGCLKSGVTTAVHEYGHRMERMHPKVNDIMQTHLAMRTTGEDGARHAMEPYQPGPRTPKSMRAESLADWRARQRSAGEWTRPDDFAEVYMGKEYDGHSSEVFTCGMEGVFAGRFGGLRGAGNWREDTAHRDLILGTLASVGKKP